MESKIDLSQVTPVNYKVTVVLVNHFALTTVQFLNRFASQCEEKLRAVSEGIYRITTGLELLEAKLNSIPFLNGDEASASESASQNQPHANGIMETTSMTTALEAAQSALENSAVRAGAPPPPPPPPPGPSIIAASPQPPQAQLPSAATSSAGGETSISGASGGGAAAVLKVKEDSRYAKFFKMVRMGVPVAAVKGKMSMEGADPAILDLDPDSPAPPGGISEEEARAAARDSDEDSD